MTRQTIRVYRVENENGAGAYHGGASCAVRDYRNRKGCTVYDHPGPWDDDGLSEFWGATPTSERNAYHFGFRSKAQLRRWFFSAKMLAALDANGMRLAVYDCPAPAVIHGTRQTIFKRPEATLVERLPLATLKRN